MTTQHERGLAFQALHRRDGLFVLPNPWDAGSAKMLAGLGFEALATTSAGLAFALGRCDAEGEVSREEALANARAIVEATPRSEERRVGKECMPVCRSRWSPYH